MNSVQDRHFLAAPVDSMPTQSSSWGTEEPHVSVLCLTLAEWKEHDLGISDDFRCACL